MGWLTRKNGVVLCLIGIVILAFNLFTYNFWEIDIDLFGAMVLILGLVIVITCGPSMKNSSKFLTRKGGVKLCIVALAITAFFAYLPIPYLGGDVTGFFGLILFIAGLIIAAIRWRY